MPAFKGVADLAFDYVEEHLAQPITAQSTADALCYHKDYLSRAVKSQSGYSLKEYINMRKIKEAKLQLYASNAPIKEIAGNLGFENANAFCKFFSYHVKMSPGEYRRLAR